MIPVKLYSTSENKEFSFNQLCPILQKNSLVQTGAITYVGAQGTLSCLIGGTISIGEGDIVASGNPDIFKAVIREAKEELSIDLCPEFNNNNIVFLSWSKHFEFKT